MRKPFVVGNWKMNTSTSEAEALINGLKPMIADVDNVDVGVAPPFVFLHKVIYTAKESRILVGAQNCYFESSGAFTGEVAPEMLKDVGCDFVILGHSERRHVLGESDEVINKKVRKALTSDLDVILCIGELLEEDRRVLLEVGPGQSLGSFVLRHPSHQSAEGTVVLPSLRTMYERQPDEAFLLNTVGKLWLAGVEID